MLRTLWREFMDGPILLWSLWPCLSPSLPLFMKARRARRFRFSTIHHLISVIIFLSVNHLEVIYFDSQHVPCNFPPSPPVPEKSELLVHNCRSVIATVDLHTVSVRSTASWHWPQKCFIATCSNKRCLQEMLEVNTSGCRPVKSSCMWRQYDPSTAGLISGTDVCCHIHIQLLSWGQSLQNVTPGFLIKDWFPFVTIIVWD